MTDTTAQMESSLEEDAKLRRHLGFWSLTAAGVGSVIGSGWLFSSMYAAQAAGPAALVSWVIGGILMLLIALVFAELGMVRPESGGLVRYPLYSNGRLAATMIGLAMWLCYVGNPPSEASGVVQYANAWLPGLYDEAHQKLTLPGIGVVLVLMAGFVLLNWFGVKLFATSNNIVTAIKFIIPGITVLLLVISGFTHRGKAGGLENITEHGGFAPYGFSAALGAIATAGLVYAYTGFRNIIELAGEAKNPTRTIPRALIATIIISIGLYLGLQTAFLMGVPTDLLEKSGWRGIDMSSPYADLAKALGFTWLYWMLIADSSLSPSGAGIIFTASNARNVFGLAKNGLLPKGLIRVHEGSGIPRRALVFNFLVGCLFLLPLPSWHAIIGITSTLMVLTFSIGAISLLAFRHVGLGSDRTRIRGMAVLAPATFIVSTLVIYWSSWTELVKTVPILIVALIWYAILHVRGKYEKADITGGLWLIAHIAGTYVLSAIGSFKGGAGWIPAPLDTVVVAVFAIAVYVWGVRSGKGYMEKQHALLEELRAADGTFDEDDREPAAAKAG